ncbi:DUF2029 domain-containing protein, partial [Mycolicibacterium vaccae]|nr:DUF2029 domain-containing protein [Mycolicibacterium vaccae]
ASGYHRPGPRAAPDALLTNLDRNRTVDLHVYIGGAAALDHPGTLYSYVYGDQTPDFPLPFTYPPFAAIVFYPLHLLPFAVVAFCWQIGTIVALYGVVRVSQRLLGVAAGAGHRVAMLWTAIAIWNDAAAQHLRLRTGQRAARVGRALRRFTMRWWLSGLLVGVAAGVKLTPAITGLYFVAVRRWGAAAFSAVVFFATVAVSWLIVADEPVITSPIDPRPGSGRTDCARPSTSLGRGGMCRIFGHDTGYGPVVLAGIAVTAVLAVAAWRALTDDDRLGRLLVSSCSDFCCRRFWPSLGVAGAADDLVDPRAAVGAARRANPRLGLARAGHRRRAVATQLRATAAV